MTENIERVEIEAEKFNANLDLAIDLVITSAAGPSHADCWYGVYPEESQRRSHLASNAAIIGLTLRGNMDSRFVGDEIADKTRQMIKQLASSEIKLQNAERGYRSEQKRMMFLSAMSPNSELNERKYGIICSPFATTARILFQEISDIALKLTISKDPDQLISEMKSHSGESIHRTDLSTGYYGSQPAVLHTDRAQATFTFPRES